MAEEKEYWCTVRDAPCECDKKGCVTTKWSELNEAIGRGDMTKRRNPQAVAAWSRHQGAHSPGTKKPNIDEMEDIDEQEQDALEDELEKMTNSIEESLRSLIEEELEEQETDDKEG
jgi:hypothetical protein